MTRTIHRYLTGVVTGLLVLSLAACASSPEKAAEKAAKKEAGPAALGYTIINKKGEPLYCKQIRPTGSNVARSTRCLTAAEWHDAQESDQRALYELRRSYDYPSTRR